MENRAKPTRYPIDEPEMTDWVLHLINRQPPTVSRLRTDKERLGLWRIDRLNSNEQSLDSYKRNPYELYYLGNWAFNEKRAKSIIGGAVYCHSSKIQTSAFGGIVLGYRWVTDPFVATERRAEFILQSRSWGKGAEWLPVSQQRAWTSYPYLDPRDKERRSKRRKDVYDQKHQVLSPSSFEELRSTGKITI